MKSIENRVKKQKGQSMVEYIIIVALIAIAAIGVYSMFGKGVRSQVAGMTQELSGESADISAAQEAAETAQELANENVDLGTYKNTATEGAQGGGE